MSDAAPTIRKSFMQFIIFGILGMAIIIGIFFLMFDNKTGSMGNTRYYLSVLEEIGPGNENAFAYIRDNIDDIVGKLGTDGTINFIEETIALKKIGISECHTLLHLVGHESYFYYNGDFDRMAVEDSIVCTQSHQHGVEAQIVLSSIDTREDLHNFCAAIRRVTPGVYCYHGAGHAFLQESLDIHYSLEMCDTLVGGPEIELPESNLSDCYRGVFSEYANQALGYDGDTGLIIPGNPRVELDSQRPFDLCISLGEKYQVSCVSQFTKVFLGSGGIEESFSKCIQDAYQAWIQARCIKTIAGVYSQQKLLEKETIKVPATIFFWSWELRKAYILGTMEGFWAFKQSDIKKNWGSFCGSFGVEKDRLFCIETFRNLNL